MALLTDPELVRLGAEWHRTTDETLLWGATWRAHRGKLAHDAWKAAEIAQEQASAAYCARYRELEAGEG